MMMGYQRSLYIGIFEVVLNFAIFSSLLYLAYYFVKGYRQTQTNEITPVVETDEQQPLPSLEIPESEF